MTLADVGSWIAAGAILAALTVPVRAATATATAPGPDLSPDSWTAVDGLGRRLPGYAEVGPPRPGKFVGMFYFLWLGQHGDNGPYDITKILARDPRAMEKPDSPLWGPIGAPHHWAESVFGYYLSDDEWVLRKHAQLLSDAGVDTVIFDTTNQLTYPQSYLALCRVWSQVRKEGGRTPQIAFLAPFGDPSRVVQTLYQDFYKPGLYQDLWFKWDGKPLILADPELIRPDRLTASQRVPAPLTPGASLGQSFTAVRPFTAVGGEFPTWSTRGSGMTLTLRQDGPAGKPLARRRFSNVVDNARVLLDAGRTLPAGHYYLEMTDLTGQVGWWSETGDVYPGGRAYSGGFPAPGDRSLFIRYEASGQAEPAASADHPLTPARAAGLNDAIHQFFTFRKPQPDYFAGPTGPGQWGWLEVYPQHAFYQSRGTPEEVTVGVAQNAVDGKLTVLSNPRSHGRSFHDGAEPGPAEQDYTGRNFAEQWRRALEIDPAFIFVTGWNEWFASRFGGDSPFYDAGPVSFVDEFNHEFSRDIEPVVGGHTDAYYYQLVANIRRFKGVRPLPPPQPPLHPGAMAIDGDFGRWRDTGAVYHDSAFDTAARSHRGWGRGMVYRSSTGRNDFVTLKVAHDAANLYFYARTRQPITHYRDPGWMLLLIDTGRAGHPGWEGFDYIVNRSVLGPRLTRLEKSAGGWSWQPAARLRYRVRGNEMEIAIPRKAVGMGDAARPVRFDFKWMDNTSAESDTLNLYRNGDTAPDGRFRYHYDGAP